MRRARNKDRSELYLCIGEKFKDNAPIGDCGITKTLMQWLVYLSRKDEDFLNQYFDDCYSNKDIVEYIYESWGKRLESTGKFVDHSLDDFC